MQYWDEMTDKYGFGDGGCEPPDARACREVYVRTLNALLVKHGSDVRVICYDRPGVHNSCLIVTVARTFFETLQPKDVLSGDVKVPDAYRIGLTDQQFGDALNDAHALCLDEFVETTVTIDPEFDPNDVIEGEPLIL